MTSNIIESHHVNHRGAKTIGIGHYLVIAGISILCVTFLIFLFSASGTESRKLKSPQVVLDATPKQAWADVYDETNVIRYHFTLGNISTEELRIERVVADCGCTGTVIVKDRLQPGEETSLYVDYSVSGVMGQLPRRAVTIFTNIQNAEPYRVYVEGRRQKRFVIDPSAIDFGVIDSGPVSKDVSIRVVGARTDEIHLLPENTLADQPWMHVQHLSTDRIENGDLVYRLKIEANPPPGNFDTKAFVPTNRNDGAGPLIYLRGHLPPPITVDPPVAFLGIIRPGQIVESTLTLHSRKGELSSSNTRISASSSLPNLEIWPDPTDTGVLHLKWMVPDDWEGPISGQVMIDVRTEDDSVRTSVEIIAFVSKGSD